MAGIPGEHSYEMKYVPAGLNIGMKISAAAFVLMLVYLLFGRRLIDKALIKRSEEPETEGIGDGSSPKPSPEEQISTGSDDIS